MGLIPAPASCCSEPGVLKESFVGVPDHDTDFILSGDDRWGYEKASERWLPVHTVETILVSVISMLADPNDE